MRMMHTMLRVTDLDRALNFYCDVLGMKLIRRKDYPEGRFTLAFVGYGDERDSTVVELTHTGTPTTTKWVAPTAISRSASGTSTRHATQSARAAVRIVREAADEGRQDGPGVCRGSRRLQSGNPAGRTKPG